MGKFLTLGSHGQLVSELNERLGLGAKPIFDQTTLEAVNAFKLAHGLVPDGRVGRQTWAALMAQPVPSVRRDRSYYCPAIPPLKTTLREKSQDEQVVVLRLRLHERGFLSQNTQSPLFDSELKAAVVAFQQANGLVADGIVGQATWTMLFAVEFPYPSTDVETAFATARIAHPQLFPHAVNWRAYQTVFSDSNRLTGRPFLTLGEFVGHFCIIYNETGGTFLPVTEIGSPAYMMTTHGGRKRSYNQPPNRRAGDQLLEWGVISSPEDVAMWNSTETYPVSQPESVRLKALDCDFYKFRGRGLNQITWREGYAKYVDPCLKNGQTSATMTNAELDAAFQDPDVYCGVFRNYVTDPQWAGRAIPFLVQGIYTEYPKYVAGSGATAYHQKFVLRCQALEAALLG